MADTKLSRSKGRKDINNSQNKNDSLLKSPGFPETEKNDGTPIPSFVRVSNLILNSFKDKAPAVQRVLDNHQTTLECLKKVADHIEDKEAGEIIGVVKFAVCQLVILEQQKEQVENQINSSALSKQHKEKDAHNEHRKQIKDLEEMLSKIPGHYTKRYLEFKDKPILMINLLIQELVEDCTFVLDVDYLPDEKEFKELREKFKKENKRAIPYDEEEKSNLLTDTMKNYVYSADIIWKYDMLEKLLQAYNEPMLNLHFLGPYLKNYSASENTYDLIF